MKSPKVKTSIKAGQVWVGKHSKREVTSVTPTAYVNYIISNTTDPPHYNQCRADIFIKHLKQDQAILLDKKYIINQFFNGD